jgi:predicted deacylase
VKLGTTAHGSESIWDAAPVERVLARARGAESGPTLVCVGGMHGNEPAGVLAIQRVQQKLAERPALARGVFLGLLGNRAALAQGARFVERDLNRGWTEEHVARLTSESGLPSRGEDFEQLELLIEIQRAIDEASGPVYLLDLHTTSGPGGIFSVFGDALPQRAFAAAFPVPMVLGLEELVDGTIIQFFGERGLVAVTVETGMHHAPEAMEHAEAAIWVALRELGMLEPEAMEEAESAERLLRRASAGLPRALEMRHRHAVHAEDAFVMEPGYRNFDRVVRGMVVARDRSGAIMVPETARILMPLYQIQGEDGFFLVRRFSPFWMWVSEWLRTAHVDRIAHWLPGVRRVPGDLDAVVVDKRVARFYARQLFHLLGFRRIDEEGARLVMRRRPFDRPDEP